MNEFSRRAMADLALSMRAADAGSCMLCACPWTVESMRERDAIVVSVDPRRLACRECYNAATG